MIVWLLGAALFFVVAALGSLTVVSVLNRRSHVVGEGGAVERETSLHRRRQLYQAGLLGADDWQFFGVLLPTTRAAGFRPDPPSPLSATYTIRTGLSVSTLDVAAARS
jgi:hypothetical protein